MYAHSINSIMFRNTKFHPLYFLNNGPFNTLFAGKTFLYIIMNQHFAKYRLCCIKPKLALEYNVQPEIIFYNCFDAESDASASANTSANASASASANASANASASAHTKKYAISMYAMLRLHMFFLILYACLLIVVFFYNTISVRNSQ